MSDEQNREIGELSTKIDNLRGDIKGLKKQFQHYIDKQDEHAKKLAKHELKLKIISFVGSSLFLAVLGIVSYLLRGVF